MRPGFAAIVPGVAPTGQLAVFWNVFHCVQGEFRMAKATWMGAVLADSTETHVVEGNHYFPAESIDKQYFKASDSTSQCPWKGEASYYNVEVEGKVNVDAAWFYPNPKDAAKQIKHHVAFWKGVEIVD
jgi:uncharacterized protein (DUF427 family)